MVFTGIRNRIKRSRFTAKYGQHTVLIYTMGKVGSASVKADLKKNYPFVPVFHVHFLSDNWLKHILPGMNDFFHSNIADAEVVFNHLKAHPASRLKVITLVRDPIERDISDVFQNWKGRLEGRTIEDVTFEELSAAFDADDHAYTLNWFDTEFREYLGFDIYREKFDTEKGYSIYKTTNADILCLQLEKLNTCISKASEEFLGYPVNVSEAVNLSADKTGKDLYKAMIKDYRASDAKLDAVYNSKFMQHFYSATDLEKFRLRWKQGSTVK